MTIRERYVQPTIETVRQEVNVNRGEPRVINHDSVTRATVTKNHNKVRKVTIPAKEYYTQPVYYREVVNNNETVKFNQTP